MTRRLSRENEAGSGAGAPERRPFRFRIGPGVITALFVSAALLINDRLNMKPPAAPVRTETASREPVRDTAPALPDPAWLLTQARELGLTTGQTAKLERLVSRWNRDTRELREALDRAAREFDAAMRERRERGTSFTDVRRWTERVSELSRRLSGAKQAWWEDAGPILSEPQRHRAEELWRRHSQSLSGTEGSEDSGGSGGS